MKNLIKLTSLLLSLLLAFALAGCDVYREVRFETNGGTPVEPIGQLNGAEVYEEPVTTREGYDFAGWYEDSDFSGERVEFPFYTRGAPDYPRVTTLYAKWLSCEITADDFVLTISAEESLLPQGEEFEINVTLKNQSGRDLEISFFITPFFPYIPGWEYPVAMFEMPELPKVLLIKDNGNYQGLWTFGDDLSIGAHELKFQASFFLSWAGHGSEDNKSVIIWSNPVMLTVTYPDVPDGTFKGLSAETEKQILRTYLDDLISQGTKYVSTIDDVYIYHYYDAYNGCYVVSLYMKNYGMTGAEKTITVDGVTFTLPSTSLEITVWKEGKLYSLQEAYCLGMLTQEDLINISN